MTTSAEDAFHLLSLSALCHRSTAAVPGGAPLDGEWISEGIRESRQEKEWVEEPQSRCVVLRNVQLVK